MKGTVKVVQARLGDVEEDDVIRYVGETRVSRWFVVERVALSQDGKLVSINGGQAISVNTICDVQIRTEKAHL